MDIDNYNDVRGRKSSPSKASSRSALISSSVSSQPYHERMVLNNDLPDKEVVKPVNSSQLSYKDKSEERNTVSKATDHESTRRWQCAWNEAPALDTSTAQHVDNNIINIQLPYDPDQPTEPDLWDGNFRPISLHGSLEHLPSDSKNIKVLLNHLAQYIENKKIDVQ